MTTPELRTTLEELLQQEEHGACTRYLCNKVFLEIRNGYAIRPGTHKMQWTYSALKSLCKQGKVICDYPGHWRAAAKNVNHEI
jgi:hypothetical protein